MMGWGYFLLLCITFFLLIANKSFQIPSVYHKSGIGLKSSAFTGLSVRNPCIKPHSLAIRWTSMMEAQEQPHGVPNILRGGNNGLEGNSANERSPKKRGTSRHTESESSAEPATRKRLVVSPKALDFPLGVLSNHKTDTVRICIQKRSERRREGRWRSGFRKLLVLC